MNHSSTPRVLIALALAGLLVGCSSSADDPADAEAGSATTTSPSDTATETEPAEVECSVKGFVPTTKVTATRNRPAVVYARSYSLAPTSKSSGTDVVLDRLDVLRVGVRSDDGSPVPKAVRVQILRTNGGPVDDGGLADTVRRSYQIRNDSNRNRSYLIYLGARAYSGTWKVRGCGAPYNDGTSVDVVTGRYSTIGRLTPLRIAECGRSSGSTGLETYAARRACELG